jgi:DnaJ-class molecular chaperone
MSDWTVRELLAYLDRVEPVLDRLSHFELLDVDAEASEEQVQGAFHHMAMRMHPDRFRLLLDPADHERLTIVYGRIAEAYRVLRNQQHREQYLRGVARDTPEAAEGDADVDSQLALLTPKAQRLFRRAQASMQTRDYASAVLNLRMALAIHPKSALLKETLAEADAARAKK